MFNKKLFLKVLVLQCTTLNLTYGQIWALAPNVFAVMIRPIKDEIDWKVLFYFDHREVKKRDKDSKEHLMAREVQLLIMNGFTVETLPDNVGTAYFNIDPTGYQSANVINYASQIFAKTDNNEISWFDNAEVLPAPLNEMVRES